MTVILRELIAELVELRDGHTPIVVTDRGGKELGPVERIEVRGGAIRLVLDATGFRSRVCEGCPW